jgi:hypothetical protein
MLPGEYTTSFAVTNKKLSIIGVGATHTGEGPTTIRIGDGADVSIRGLQIDLTRGDFQCRATPGNPRAKLALRNVVVREPASFTTRMLDCSAKIIESEFRGIAANSVVIFQRNSVIDVDRSIFKGGTDGTYSTISMSSLGMGSFGCNNGECAPIDVQITNSVFDDSNIFLAFGTESPSTIRIAFSTLVVQDPGNNFPAIGCDNVGTTTVRLENSALLRNGQDAVVGNGCALKNNVIFPQSAPLSGTGNKFTDPKFVDFTTRDYRLRPDSPARDAASPSADLSTDHDFLGVSRPQGSALDIGAFELKP